MADFLHQVFGEGADVCWWARAILEDQRARVKRKNRQVRVTKRVCILVGTNQGSKGAEEQKKKFLKRLNAAKRLTKARKRAAESFYPGSYGDTKVLFEDKFVRIWGRQEGSYVYLYAEPRKEAA